MTMFCTLDHVVDTFLFGVGLGVVATLVVVTVFEVKLHERRKRKGAAG